MHRAAAEWLRGVLADPPFDDEAKLVARAMASHMDRQGHVSATDAEIAIWVDELRSAES